MFLWLSLACQSCSAALRAGTLDQKTRAKAFFSGAIAAWATVLFLWPWFNLSGSTDSSTACPLQPVPGVRFPLQSGAWSLLSSLGQGLQSMSFPGYLISTGAGAAQSLTISSISIRAAFSLSSPTTVSHPLPFCPMLVVSKAFCVFLLGSRLVSSALQAGLYSDEHPC